VWSTKMNKMEFIARKVFEARRSRANSSGKKVDIAGS